MEKTIFIKIGVERLTIGKKFAREVFIGMPKNGKMIRIVAIGDEIRPSLLAKLHERSSEIFVTAFPEDPSEPDLVPLYEEHSRNEEQSPETAGFVNEKTLATERAEIVKGAEEFSSNRISEESSLSVKEIDSESKQVGGDVSKTSSSERLIDEANKTSKKLFASDEVSAFSAAEAPTEAFRFSNDPAATPEDSNLGALDPEEMLEKTVQDTLSSPSPDLELTKMASRHKNLPPLAAKMATLLSYSLGYGDFNFLSDVALAVFMKFSERNGLPVNTETISEFPKAIISRSRSANDSPLCDAIDILELLECYFEDPNFDRTAKTLSIKTFRSTVKSLSERLVDLNEWNIERWNQFIESGPALKANAICSQVLTSVIETTKTMHVSQNEI